MRWDTKQTVAPTSDPLTLAETKTYLRVKHTKDDALITALIKSATKSVEVFTRRQVVSATHVLYLDGFHGANAIALPATPVQTINSIVYIDTAGVTQTWDASNYIANLVRGEVSLAFSKTWPSVRQQWNGVQVQYSAGYAGTENDLEVIRQTMLAMIATSYDVRSTEVVGTITSTVNNAGKRMLWPVRTFFTRPWK